MRAIRFFAVVLAAYAAGCSTEGSGEQGSQSRDAGTRDATRAGDGSAATGGADGTASGGAPGSGGATGAGAGGASGEPGADASSSGGNSAAGGASDAGATDGSMPASSGCLAFDPPSRAVLRASPHKVFAHYFAPFPVSIDNMPEASDYYTRGYLAPGGESGKWQFCGGYLRDRPVPQTPSTASTWFTDDYDLEIRRAADMGLDGFTFDILGTSGQNWDRLGQLLTAAERTDPGFAIALMPDMYATFTGDAGAATTSFVDAISTITKAHPSSVFKLADGRVVVAPYGAEKRDAAWWTATLKALTDAGVPNAFVPLFSNVPWEAAAKAMKATVPMYGTASWGVRTPSGAPGLMGAAAAAHADGLTWMAPVAPQDMRPKDLVYREARNSLAFRLQWDAAIGGNADWVQLITWNDYSEHTEVSPSARAGFAFSDLSAYYVTWFKTGSAPRIVRDRLFYFHRVHATTAKPDLTKQTGGAFKLMDATPATDEIELVAFLKSPGKIGIHIGSVNKEIDAPAGLTALRAPLSEGRPSFSLSRNGQAVLSVESDFPISNDIVYEDLFYRAGESPRCGP